MAGQKGVLIHDIKYEKIQKDQMQQMIITFVHHTAVNETPAGCNQTIFRK